MIQRKGMGKGKGKGYKNIIPYDKKVHSESAKGRKQPQKIQNSRPNSTQGHEIDKATFRKHFEEAMKNDTIFCTGYLKNGDYGVTSREKVTPKIVIRDFAGDDYFDDYGEYHQDIPDREFTDFNKAWKYLQGVEKYRIMDIGGSILADNYCGDDE